MSNDEASQAGVRGVRDREHRRFRAESTWRDLAWSAGKVLATAIPVVSILLAAITYFDQHAEQRRADLLQAYNLVEGNLGTSIATDIKKALKPFYTNEEFAQQRTLWACYAALSKRLKEDEKAGVATDVKNSINGSCYDNADEKPSVAKERILGKIQNWITSNILVNGKDSDHDHYIHNYRYAALDLRFLYEFARADPCNATAVVYRFQQDAINFWYYYPGYYDFEMTRVVGKSPPEEARLADSEWASTQGKVCLDGLNHPFREKVAPVLEWFQAAAPAIHS